MQGINVSPVDMCTLKNHLIVFLKILYSVNVFNDKRSSNKLALSMSRRFKKRSFDTVTVSVLKSYMNFFMQNRI